MLYDLSISVNAFLHIIYFIMEITTGLPEILDNEIFSATNSSNISDNFKEQSIGPIKSIIASVGIVANLTVVILCFLTIRH